MTEHIKLKCDTCNGKNVIAFGKWGGPLKIVCKDCGYVASYRFVKIEDEKKES